MPVPVSPRFVDRLCKASNVLRSIDAIATGVAGTATALGSKSTIGRFAVGAKLISGLHSDVGRLPQARMHYVSSGVLYGLWAQAPELGSFCWGDEDWSARVVGDAVLACKRASTASYYVLTSHTEDEVLQAVRETSDAWRITYSERSRSTELSPWAPATYPVVSVQTRKVIDESRRYASCRAWLLHGPPGSGKSVAAQQIAIAVGGGSIVTLDGESARNAETWGILEVLRPAAVVINDIDAVDERALNDMLDRLERAHSWARVIVSTANTLDDLRGALLRPGRLADSAPVRYERLDATTLRAIAPSVPADLLDEGLLASYAAELEARAKVRAVTQSDLDEMLERTAKAGER